MKSRNLLLFLFILTSSVAHSADISFFLQCEPDCLKTIIKVAEPSSINSQESNGSVYKSNDFGMRSEKGFSIHEYNPTKKPKIENGPYIYKDNKGTDNTNVNGGWIDEIDNSSGIWHATDENKNDNIQNIKLKDNILEK